MGDQGYDANQATVQTFIDWIVMACAPNMPGDGFGWHLVGIEKWTDGRGAMLTVETVHPLRGWTPYLPGQSGEDRTYEGPKRAHIELTVEVQRHHGAT